MKLTTELIRNCFGPDVRITSRLRGGYKVRTGTGGTAIVTRSRCKDITGGTDLHEGIVRISQELWGHVKVTGSMEFIAHMISIGQAIGIRVEAAGEKHFFGLIQEPPPAIPGASGAHGSQALAWKDADLKAARLLGASYGEGIRVGASLESGTPLRYAGADAENSVLGIGPPGSGKGVSYQIPAILEWRGSLVVIDPSGQLFAACARELMQRGVRVIPIMPFPQGLPSEIAALAKRTRCLNPMHLLGTDSESLMGDCAQLAQFLKPEEKGTGGDPFFSLSGRNLITVLIACVKLYSHPAEQNLSEVYHKLGNVFAYARSILAKPNVPRFIGTQLQRLAAPAAETNKTLLSIIETALAELAWVSDEAVQRVLRTSSFVWDDLKNAPRPVALWSLLPVNRLDSHKPFLTLTAGTALMGLGNTGRGKHQVLMVVDEAALLGYMPILQRAFAESRKRGVQLSVWFQNIHQAEAIYGKAWLNMLSGSDVQIFLRPRDLGTAKFICDQIGTTTQITPHFSHAPGRGSVMQESVSFNEQGRPVMFPQEVMALSDGQAIMLAPGRSKNALLIWARPYFDCPDLKGKAGIDPYHRHRAREAKS